MGKARQPETRPDGPKSDPPKAEPAAGKTQRLKDGAIELCRAASDLVVGHETEKSGEPAARPEKDLCDGVRGMALCPEKARVVGGPRAGKADQGACCCRVPTTRQVLVEGLGKRIDEVSGRLDQLNRRTLRRYGFVCDGDDDDDADDGGSADDDSDDDDEFKGILAELNRIRDELNAGLFASRELARSDFVELACRLFDVYPKISYENEILKYKVRGPDGRPAGVDVIQSWWAKRDVLYKVLCGRVFDQEMIQAGVPIQVRVFNLERLYSTICKCESLELAERTAMIKMLAVAARGPP